MTFLLTATSEYDKMFVHLETKELTSKDAGDVEPANDVNSKLSSPILNMHVHLDNIDDKNLVEHLWFKHTSLSRNRSHVQIKCSPPVISI